VRATNVIIVSYLPHAIFGQFHEYRINDKIESALGSRLAGTTDDFDALLILRELCFRWEIKYFH
jgi:hypothetical protein